MSTKSHCPTPVFVVGSPRSGTTMIGAYLASAPSVVGLGEFAAFYFTSYIAQREYRLTSTPYVQTILAALQDAAVREAHRLADDQRAQFFVDSTPWNLRAIPFLVKTFPRARFVLVLRHYRGAIQSMERSYPLGYRWAGPDDETRARTWSELYTLSLELPADLTVAVSYDWLCKEPSAAIADLQARGARLDLPMGDVRDQVLSISYATTGTRPVIASSIASGGIRFHGRPTYDKSDWSPDREGAVAGVCAHVWANLSTRYAESNLIEAHEHDAS